MHSYGGGFSRRLVSVFQPSSVHDAIGYEQYVSRTRLFGNGYTYVALSSMVHAVSEFGIDYDTSLVVGLFSSLVVRAMLQRRLGAVLAYISY